MAFLNTLRNLKLNPSKYADVVPFLIRIICSFHFKVLCYLIDFLLFDNFLIMEEIIIPEKLCEWVTDEELTRLKNTTEVDTVTFHDGKVICIGNKTNLKTVRNLSKIFVRSLERTMQRKSQQITESIKVPSVAISCSLI